MIWSLLRVLWNVGLPAIGGGGGGGGHYGKHSELTFDKCYNFF